MANAGLPTPERLRQLVRYEPETGKFYWLPRTTMEGFSGEAPWRVWNTQFAGKEAFACRDKLGYATGCVFNRRIKAHRAAWAIHYGEWPSGMVDHINRDPSDNRIENLRVVTRGQNAQNAKIRCNNTSGVAGVYWNKGKGRWVAMAKRNGRQITLGTYTAKEDAIAARRRSEIEDGYHPENRT